MALQEDTTEYTQSKARLSRWPTDYAEDKTGAS